MFVLYAADDENGSRQWIESPLPFQGQIDCTGCRPEMVPDIEVTLAERTLEVRPDYDGEERILQLDAVLELDIRIYEEDTVQILEDVYAPSKELTPVFGEESYESLLIRNYAKSRISDRIRISENSPRLLQICHCRGEVKVDEIAKTEQGIKMEGAIEISVLYITADDEHPFALVTGMIPFSHLMEAEGITSECRFHLHPQIEQLSASMSGEEVEIKGTLSLNLFAVRIMHQNCILDIEEKELESEKTAGTPGDRLLCGTAGGYSVGHCEKVLHHIRTYQKHEPSDRRNPCRTETTDREISGSSYGLLRKEQQNILLTILYF